MKLTVSTFSSQSKTAKKQPKKTGRVTRAKYTETLKPKERIAYLEKFPRSSFRLITDEKGNIVDKKTRTKKQPAEKKPAKPRKKKLSGSPRKTPTQPARKRNAFTKALTKRVTEGLTPAKKKRVNAAIQKINDGTATKRNLDTLTKLTDEGHHEGIKKAFNLSKKRSKADTERRRKDISSDKSTGTRKKTSKQSNSKPAASPKKDKQPVAKPEAPKKPDSKNAAMAVQELPKSERGKFVEVLKRVFSRKTKPDDLKRIDAASRKVKSKTSREAMAQVRRYAEAGVGKKVNARKKLTKIQKLDRIKNVEMPKSQKDREQIDKLNKQFKEFAKGVATGKGTKAQRYKKIKAEQKKVKARVDKIYNRMTARNVKIREMIQSVRDEDDRAVGSRKDMKSESAVELNHGMLKQLNGSQIRSLIRNGTLPQDYDSPQRKENFTIGKVIQKLKSWQQDYEDLEREWEQAIGTPEASKIKVRLDRYEDAIDKFILTYNLDVGRFNDGYHYEPTARIKVRTRLPFEKVPSLLKHDPMYVKRQKRLVQKLNDKISEYEDVSTRLTGSASKSRTKHLIKELQRRIIEIESELR